MLSCIFLQNLITYYSLESVPTKLFEKNEEIEERTLISDIKLQGGERKLKNNFEKENVKKNVKPYYYLLTPYFTLTKSQLHHTSVKINFHLKLYF